MNRSGVADLPLHGGSVPRWLAERITRLGTAIAENVIHHYGTTELLSRLADPFWFQAIRERTSSAYIFAVEGAGTPEKLPMNYAPTLPPIHRWRCTGPL